MSEVTPIATILLWSVLVAAAGCTTQPSMNAEFVAALESLGFFIHAAPDDAEAMRGEILASGWSGIFGKSGRFFPADAEDLAEGGVGRFVEDLRPFLEHQEVVLENLRDSFEESGYSVSVNGTDFVIWTHEDTFRAETEPGLLWGAATMRSFTLVNDLLARANSRERLYAVNGGNDLMAIFLTEELRALVNRHPDAQAESRPYIPMLEYPWFGQEHE